MTIGELVYLIRADGSKLSSDLNTSEKDVKGWGQKISSWTVAKGQMIAKFAEKALASVANISKQVMRSTIDAYSTFEQLEGGTKLLFGNNDRTLQQYLKDVGITEKSTKKQIDSATASFEKNSRAQDFIFAKAADAYKNVQMSQNDYLTTANAFATGLKTSLGGDSEAAAQLADDIITAQADVVAATGASQESVANAFAGIMKGNYTMLDNLQLGITPTKKGMQDLINQVNKWNKANGKATKYNIKNLADQQKALVDYIKMQGLSGYAGMEAANTIQGTMAMTKAAWMNLLIAFGSGKDVKAATKNLAESAKKLLKNMLPVFKESLSGIKEFIVGLIPEIKAGLDKLIKKFKESDSPILRGIGSALETIQNVCSWISENQETVVTAIGAIIAAFSITKLLSIVGSLNKVSLTIGAIAALAVLITTNWSSVEEFFTELWSSVKTSVDDAWSSVTLWWTGIKESVETAWSSIATWFDENVWTPVKTNFETAWNKIQELWTGISTSIETAWSTIAGWFGENVWTPIQTALQPVIDLVKSLWDGIASNIETAWATISGWFDENVWTPISTAFTGLWNTVQQLWSDITSPIEQAWSGAEAALAPVLESIQDKFKGVIDWATNTIDKIKELLGINTKEETPIPTTSPNPSGSNVPHGIPLTEDQANSLAGWRKFAQENPDALVSWNGETVSSSEAFRRATRSTLEANGFDENAVNDLTAKITGLSTSSEAFSKTIVELSTATTSSVTPLTALGEYSASTSTSVEGLGTAADSAADELSKIKVTTSPNSNAKGLWTVPYDDYVTRLHRNEMVLSASQARRYKEGKTDSGATGISGMSRMIVAAIREGMSDASVNAYVNGEGMTSMVNNNTANRLKSRRFAPA